MCSIIDFVGRANYVINLNRIFLWKKSEILQLRHDGCNFPIASRDNFIWLEHIPVFVTHLFKELANAVSHLFTALRRLEFNGADAKVALFSLVCFVPILCEDDSYHVHCEVFRVNAHLVKSVVAPFERLYQIVRRAELAFCVLADCVPCLALARNIWPLLHP